MNLLRTNAIFLMDGKIRHWDTNVILGCLTFTSLSVEESAISDLPPAVKDLLHKHITSVHQLELLLLLKRYSDRNWLPRELARELYSHTLAVEDELRRLEDVGFVVRTEQEQSEPRFRYFAKTDDLDRAATELMQAYRDYRIRVIDAIFSKQQAHLRHFSDAFRLRPEDQQ